MDKESLMSPQTLKSVIKSEFRDGKEPDPEMNDQEGCSDHVHVQPTV